MKTFIKPFAKLLNKFSYARKFLFIFILIFIPMTVVTLLYFQGIRQDIQTSESERNGIVYLNEVRQLIQLTQQHRGLSSGFLNGDKSIEPLLKEKKNEVNEVYGRISDLIDSQDDRYHIRQDYEKIVKEWESLSENITTYNSKTSIALHGNLIKDIMDFSALVAGESALFLDKELINYHMVVLIVDKLQMITELMGQSRAIGTGVAANGSKTSEQEFQLIQLKYYLERQVHDVDSSLQAIYRENNILEKTIGEKSTQALKDIEELITILDKEFLSKTSVTINSIDYYNFTTNSINGYYEFIELTSQLLDDRLAERIQKDKILRNVVFVLITATMFIISFFFIVFYYSIKDAIREVELATASIAEGDLTRKVVINTKDEMKKIGDSLNNMVFAMKEIIQSNQQISQELASSSEELTIVTEESAKSTEQITHSIEDISKTIEYQLMTSTETKIAVDELTVGLNSVIKDSNQVANFALEVTKEAELGGKLVSNTIQQMNVISNSITSSSEVIEELNEKSKNISEIINVITAIADQTNLLALNAAIEAARAGDHGKGFAVVANEVRKLAEQSGSSAQTINNLIQAVQEDTNKAKRAMEKVMEDSRTGISVVNETGKGFEKIVVSTKGVESQITDVASKALSMNKLIEQLIHSVNENNKNAEKTEMSAQTIASASQEQLASMEEIASAVQTLNGQAQDLHHTIDKFKI